MTTGELARLFLGVSSGSEGGCGRVGTDPPSGRIQRFDAPHVVVIETEGERPEVLPQALEAHRFRNDNRTAVEMPANDDLRRGFPMLRSDTDDHRLAEQSAPTEVNTRPPF